MRRRLFLVLMSVLLVPAAAIAKPLRVVATVPNLASIAREIGGEKIDESSIASGLQDAHFVDPKPSFIVRLRSADLLLVNGLDLEIGWVPALTQGARNRRIVVGGKDYIDCSTGVGVVEIPQGTLSRAVGDVHPYGNPHYLTDPLNAEVVARHLAAVFTARAPEDAEYFERRLAGFSARLHLAMFGEELVEMVGGPRLSRLARTGQLMGYLESAEMDGTPLVKRLGGWMGALYPYKGTAIVTYHRDYSYFTGRFGLRVAGYVEPKPGIPPSARQLTELTTLLERGGVKVIITRPFLEKRSTGLLHDATGVPVLTFPLEVGGADEVNDIFDLFDLVTRQLVGVFEASADSE